MWIDERYQALFERDGLRSLGDLFGVREAKRFDKIGLANWRERIAIDLTGDDGSTHRFYVKRFLNPPAKEQRRRRFAGHGKRSTAGVERYWIDTLRADGVSVPKIAAFGEEMAASNERRSVLVLAEVRGQSLEKWAENRVDRAPRRLVNELATFVSRFHERGYIHRDLYLCHIFLDGDAETPERLTMIDLQRIMQNPMRRKRWIARELAQLAYSTPESVAGPRQRLRFLKRYLGGQSLRDAAARAMIRRVLCKVSQIAAHDARRLLRGGR